MRVGTRELFGLINRMRLAELAVTMQALTDIIQRWSGGSTSSRLIRGASIAGWRALAKTFENRHAVVVLPPGAGGHITGQKHKRWLSKGQLAYAAPREEILMRVLSVIGQPEPNEGLAALRFWGQTGERSAAWMAAADPVHLEATMNDLRLHALRENEVPATDLRVLFEYLQQILGGDNDLDFACLGTCGYLRGDQHIMTATVSSDIVDRCNVDEFMPDGETTTKYHRLLSELQMALHEHEVNKKREAAGARSINSLWFWGGGSAPEKERRPIPPLFSNDPLFKGYWESCTGVVDKWTSDFDHCLDIATNAFVAVAPDVHDDTRPAIQAEYLDKLRLLLRRGRLSRLTLLFRDGLSVEVGKYDVFRLWRTVSPLLQDVTRND